MAVEDKIRTSGELPRSEPVLPIVNPAVKDSQPPKSGLHPAIYVATWISLSSSLIIFNKYILDKAGFHFPIVLTTWHLVFATVMTQLLARFTTLLDARKTVPMTGRVYLRAILPIGFFTSMSLICGNLTYLYLSVSFIQMLKASMPFAVLMSNWAFGISTPTGKTIGNVCIIVFGVMIASYGEINFVFIGVLYQIGGIVFEAMRLTLIGRLLNSAEFKMDPLVSLYYFAPACAIMNGFLALVVEIPRMTMSDVYNVGIFVLIANASVAFLLNVSVVMLIGKTSSLIFTLCGVLKDILLVFASMAIFGDPVSLLQAFGYSVALAGLVYYKLGGETIKGYLGTGFQSFADWRAKHPALAKTLYFGIFLFVVLVLMGGALPFVPVEYKRMWLPGGAGSETLESMGD